MGTLSLLPLLILSCAVFVKISFLFYTLFVLAPYCSPGSGPLYYAFTCFWPSLFLSYLFICVLHSCVCMFVSHLLVGLPLVTLLPYIVRYSHSDFPSPDKTHLLSFPPHSYVCVTNIRPSDTSFICPSSPTSHRSSIPSCHLFLFVFFKVPSRLILFDCFLQEGLLSSFLVFLSSTSQAPATQSLALVFICPSGYCSL